VDTGLTDKAANPSELDNVDAELGILLSLDADNVEAEVLRLGAEWLGELAYECEV